MKHRVGELEREPEVAAKRKADKFRIDEALDAFDDVMSTRSGRRMIHYILHEVAADVVPWWQGSSSTDAVNASLAWLEGARAISDELVMMIRSKCPEKWVQMQQEEIERQRDMAAAESDRKQQGEADGRD